MFFSRLFFWVESNIEKRPTPFSGIFRTGQEAIWAARDCKHFLVTENRQGIQKEKWRIFRWGKLSPDHGKSIFFAGCSFGGNDISMTGSSCLEPRWNSDFSERVSSWPRHSKQALSQRFVYFTCRFICTPAPKPPPARGTQACGELVLCPSGSLSPSGSCTHVFGTEQVFKTVC